MNTPAWTNYVGVKDRGPENNGNAMVKWIISEYKGPDAAEMKENKAIGVHVGNDVIVMEDVAELEHMDVELHDDPQPPRPWRVRS